MIPAHTNDPITPKSASMRSASLPGTKACIISIHSANPHAYNNAGSKGFFSFVCINILYAINVTTKKTMKCSGYPEYRLIGEPPNLMTDPIMITIVNKIR